MCEGWMNEMFKSGFKSDVHVESCLPAYREVVIALPSVQP
jgi:hypothetical protein